MGLQESVAAALRDRYLLVREIGRGGSAIVFAARDVRLDRQVAIKVLEPELTGSIGRERFEREVRVEARLQHPHILPVLEAGEAGGHLFCVLPLVEGTTLAHRLSEHGALPVDTALRLGEEIARALEHAHAHGIVHRDLKPENVLLSDGQALVCDFGIARALHDPRQAALTTTGAILGTPRYMSPEQASGMALADGRSDLYSLGCMLYEMLVGRPPFEATDASALLRQHLSAPVPPLGSLRPQIGPGVEAVVLRCLEKLPADRPSGAGELADQLAALRRGAAGVAAPPGRTRPVRVFAAAALVVAVAAAGLWLALHRLPGGGRIDSLAVLPLRNLTGDPRQDYFADGVTEALINDLARVRSMRVISRTSSMALRGTALPLPEVAARLGVDAVVEGSIARSANRVRISAQLVQADPERSLWADSYERELADILQLQAEVSQAITRSIRAELTAEERSRYSRAARRVDPAVYEDCLRGQHLLRTKFDLASYRRALASFEQASRRDPTFAPAWAGVADAWYNLSSLAVPAAEAMPRARTAAQRALQIDSTLGQAWTIQGLVLSHFDYDWRGGERSLRRAVALSPSGAHGHWALAILLLETARPDEGLAEMRRACALDPLSSYFRVGLAWAHLRAGQMDEAVATARGVLAQDREDAAALNCLAACMLVQGRADSAIVAAERAVRFGDSPYFSGQLGRALARAGRRAEARSVLERLERAAPDGMPSARGFVLYELGETDTAYRQFARAARERDEEILTSLVDPGWDRMWVDPRGVAIKRSLGL